MLILGIDTSAQHGSVALLKSAGIVQEGAPDTESEEVTTIELAMLGEGRASELLVQAMDALLARNGVEKHALSLIALASGPGSFTGLRVAVATAKGLAEAFAVPVVAVSVLEAVALASGVQGRVLAVLDAQRGELFYGEYAVAGAEHAERLREGISAMSDFISDVHTDSLRVIVTPDVSLADRLRDTEPTLQVSEVRRPTADDFARIAHRKFLAGERADPASLDANYLRRSDAEIVAERKRQA